jgi:hypothetical protein
MEKYLSMQTDNTKTFIPFNHHFKIPSKKLQKQKNIFYRNLCKASNISKALIALDKRMKN